MEAADRWGHLSVDERRAVFQVSCAGRARATVHELRFEPPPPPPWGASALGCALWRLRRRHSLHAAVAELAIRIFAPSDPPAVSQLVLRAHPPGRRPDLVARLPPYLAALVRDPAPRPRASVAAVAARPPPMPGASGAVTPGAPRGC